MSVGTIAVPSRRRLAARAVLVATLAATVLLLTILGALVGAESRIRALYDPSQAAVSEIPGDYLVLYQKAAARYGLDWTILAAIGAVESSHGRSDAPGVRSGVNAFGCCAGPMQFNVHNGPPSTWDAYAVDGNGDGVASVYDPADAIPAAARLLRANGAPTDYRRALFAYNHADWYVDRVLRQAADYRGSVAFAAAPVSASPWALLANPRFTSSNPAATTYDLEHGLVDGRVIALLALALREHRIGVSVFKTGHSMHTDRGTVSNHFYGRAVDIVSVDGEPCAGARVGACGRLAVELAALPGVLDPTELIYCFDPDGPSDPNGFAQADHCKHVHFGYD